MSDDFRDYGTDFRLIFGGDGRADIAWDGEDVDIVAGLDNLAQALTMRLLVQRGELTELAHPRYGSRTGRVPTKQFKPMNFIVARGMVRAVTACGDGDIRLWLEVRDESMLSGWPEGQGMRVGDCACVLINANHHILRLVRS